MSLLAISSGLHRWARGGSSGHRASWGRSRGGDHGLAASVASVSGGSDVGARHGVRGSLNGEWLGTRGDGWLSWGRSGGGWLSAAAGCNRLDVAVAAGAGQVVERSVVEVWSNNREGDRARARRRVVQGEPPQVGASEELASNSLPVGLGVLSRGDSLAGVGALDWPSGLSNPHGLAIGDVDGGVVAGKEELSAVLDAVCLSSLVVWVSIHSKPVDSVDDGGVAAVDPGGPGVDVSQLRTARRSAADQVADLVDVVDEAGWSLTTAAVVLNASRSDAVQVLRSDRDTIDEVGEGGAILVDGVLQGSQLLVERVLASASPKTEQQSGLGVDGGGNGRSDSVWRATLDHGVQTGGAEARLALEVLRAVELVLKVLLGADRAIVVGGTVVESPLLSEGGAKERSQSKETHREIQYLCKKRQ